MVPAPWSRAPRWRSVTSAHRNQVSKVESDTSGVVNSTAPNLAPGNYNVIVSERKAFARCANKSGASVGA